MRLVNYALFQAAWFGCVAGAARAWAPAAALPVALQSVLSAPRPWVEVRALAAAAALGLLGEWALIGTGVLDFAGGPWPFPPATIVALWAAFASTFGLSLSWLAARPLAAAAFGGIGSPLSYLAAERLGAVRLGPDPWTAAAALGAVWALSLPLSMLAYRRAGGGAR